MATTSIDHLCVLIHGLWGNPPHLDYLRKTLKETHSDRLHVLVAKNNADYFTYDGIEVGGERIAHEIEEAIQDLTERGAKLTKISVIGYSLGGLVARYTVGLLYKDGVFERLKPVNFTTFASPWIGVRSPHKGLRGAAWNAVAPRTLSVTGRQMFVNDKFRDTNRPLLAILAKPESIFMRGLTQFKNKSLYANTMNDRSVPYYTASFSRTDPFTDLDMVDIHYMPNQDEKVLLDPENPATLKASTHSLSVLERWKSRSRRLASELPFFALLTILLPIAGSLMIVNGAYQSYKSAGRIKLHESGKTSVNSQKYRVALLEETQAMQDRAIGRLMNSQSADDIPTDRSADEAGSGSCGFAALALNADQLEMIANLEQVGITKYRAHIQKARHTHAVIVVRYQDERFTEGVAVVNHWAQHFEA